MTEWDELRQLASGDAFYAKRMTQLIDALTAHVALLEAEHAAAMKWIPTWRRYGADIAGPERIAWCDAVAAVAAQEVQCLIQKSRAVGG